MSTAYVERAECPDDGSHHQVVTTGEEEPLLNGNGFAQTEYTNPTGRSPIPKQAHIHPHPHPHQHPGAEEGEEESEESSEGGVAGFFTGHHRHEDRGHHHHHQHNHTHSRPHSRRTSTLKSRSASLTKPCLTEEPLDDCLIDEEEGEEGMEEIRSRVNSSTSRPRLPSRSHTHTHQRGGRLKFDPNCDDLGSRRQVVGILVSHLPP